MIVAFIPARGGSKRLPGKNLLPLGGLPLVAHAILLARAVPAIDRVVVSTDDADLADVARRYGATSIERPERLSGDHAPTALAAQHAARHLVARGIPVETMVTLQPTQPLRDVETVEATLALLASSGADCAMTVSRVEHKLGTIHHGRFLPEYELGQRTQDLPERYREDGLVYATRGEVVLERGEIFGDRIAPLISDPLFASVDIDTALDFELAEWLFDRHRHRFAHTLIGTAHEESWLRPSV